MLKEEISVAVRQTVIACGVDRVVLCLLQMVVWMLFILLTIRGSHFSSAATLSHLNLDHLQPFVLILGEPMFIYHVKGRLITNVLR